jgi:hypothetical protein
VAADPPPADFEVSRTGPDESVQNIYACRAHLAETRRRMAGDGFVLTVGPANRDSDGNPLPVPAHGCKGHLDGWPAAGD